MRLINTSTLAPEEFISSSIPTYAILSHTWEEDEATYAHWMSPSGLEGPGKGKVKIRSACELARRQGYRYIWVDTCCIDKSSSAELTEAINSMFQWYRNARVCYAYFSDLSTADSLDRMKSCRWFTRGWTLQELIAPKAVEFYDQGWQYRGDKTDLTALITHITNIDKDVLWGGKSLESIPVARKMAWAAPRTTTREEDIAYCLLGIFDVNLPLIYGEGCKAFMRLQEEIIKQTNDLSIFCWLATDQGIFNDGNQPDRFRGVLASSPLVFKDAQRHTEDSFAGRHAAPEFTITNKGIRINSSLVEDFFSGLWFMCLDSVKSGDRATGIWLKRYGDGTAFARARPKVLPTMECNLLHNNWPSQFYLTKVIPRELQLYVENSTPNRFSFSWNSGSPYYQYRSTRPQAGWNQDEKTFFTSDGPFMGRHYFTCNRPPSAHTTPLNLVLVFGKAKHWLPPWFCIWGDNDDMLTKSLIWVDLAEIESAGMAKFQQDGSEQALEVSGHLETGLGNGLRKDTASKTLIRVSLISRRPTEYSGWQIDIAIDVDDA